MYDIFLSHNRKQKPWVRRLYRFLTEHGLTVYFDEESVAPGESIVASIERGLENSRCVLLILSPESLGSQWVALETELVLVRSSGTASRVVIPVQIEDVDLASIRPTLRTLNWIDLRDPTSREARLRFLLKHLGLVGIQSIPVRQLDELLVLREEESTAEVHVGNIEDVLLWGWDGRELLEALIRLDYETTESLTAVHEGDPEQWGPVFMTHPETWRLLTLGTKRIIGYWHMAPLFPPEYLLAKAGKLRDSEITVDRVRFFELPGVYDTYFVQVCLLPQYRRTRNVQLLFESIFDVLDGLSQNRIFIREVTANAYTRVGIGLCRTFDIDYLCDHSEHGAIYCAPISRVLHHPLAGRFPGLRGRYADVGLFDRSDPDERALV